jgi:DNA-binding MarR family transcriptional regulator
MKKLDKAAEHESEAESDTSDTLSSMAVLNGILKLSNKVMAPFSTYLEKQYAISLNEFRLLMLIGQYPTYASHELAALTGVTTMSVSRAVSALQKHGRLKVERDAANGRRKVLALTAEGVRLFEVMKPQSEKVASYLLSDFTEAERKRLHGEILRMLATLEAVDEAGESLFMKQARPQRPA